MTNRELINHLESLDVPDDSVVMIERIEWTTNGWTESEYEELALTDAPQIATNENQRIVIVIGDVDKYRAQVESA